MNAALERQLVDLIVTRCSPNSLTQKISAATARKYIPCELKEWGKVQIYGTGDRASGRACRKPEPSTRDSCFVRVSHACASLAPSACLTGFNTKYECLVDRNADNDGPEDLISQTFFGELQRVVRLDLPRSREIHQPQDKTVLLAHVKTCEAVENEDGFWEYSSMKPSPHFMDLNTIVCVVGRVRDRGHWTFVDRSGPTAHVKIASPPSSQCSDITDFSTSDESESGFGDPESSSGGSLSSNRPANDLGGAPMDVDTSSTGSSD